MAIEISALYTYPIKSCGAVAHEAIALDKRGLLFDRHWMVVSGDGKDKGVCLTGRENPKMTVIQPHFDGDTLAISAPNMSPIQVPLVQNNSHRTSVQVWDDTCQAIDEGDAVAEWFSDFLGMSVRLVAMADDFSRVVDTDYTGTPTETGFSDGYPLLVISEGSLVDLNQRLEARGKMAIPMSRFRTNVVVKGCDPNAEDSWKQMTLSDIPFDVVKPCKRCSMVTIDGATGTIPDVKEPTATLAEYRRWNNGVIFGQNIIHRGLGTLRVGDAVTIIG